MGLTEVTWGAIGTAKSAFATCSRFFPQRLAMLSGYMEFGRWLRDHKMRRKDSIVVRDRFYSHVHDKFIAGGPIDYLEFGVFRGASIKYWLKVNRAPASRFFGFDSFEGLPEQWRHLTFSHSAGTFDLKGKAPDVDDDRLTFVRGWFQDSLPPFLQGFAPQNRLVIHLDADLYSSTMFVLARLSHLLKPGTLIILDDFSSTSTCVFRALRDFATSFRCEYKVVAHGGVCFDHVCIEITRQPD